MTFSLDSQRVTIFIKVAQLLYYSYQAMQKIIWFFKKYPWHILGFAWIVLLGVGFWLISQQKTASTTESIHKHEESQNTIGDTNSLAHGTHIEQISQQILAKYQEEYNDTGICCKIDTFSSGCVLQIVKGDKLYAQFVCLGGKIFEVKELTSETSLRKEN